mmetsp:Transcript_9354/g.15654  ORF Transcript_9354/g.15654 Transcript_9354/m.15654 type:complete len:320 (+) Transcript_9354:80-1039(+)
MYSKVLLPLALSLASSPGTRADFIVLDVSPGDPTCSPENSEASIMIQTDHCLQLPSNIPLANSYMFESCSTGADAISATINVFGSNDCSGMMKSYTFDSIPSACMNGTQFSCQTSDPYAVVENWPAFGLYVDDTTCSLPTLMAAFAPNCNTFSFEGISFSTDLTCSAEAGASLTLYGTNESIPYDECNGEPSEQRTMIADQCTSFANFEPITLPEVGNIMDGKLKEIIDLLQLDSSDLYYYADCGGADNIPGIETNSNSGSTSDSGDDVDAGMMALYVVLAGVAGLALAVTGFIYYRRQGNGYDRDTISDDLIDKDNEA